MMELCNCSVAKSLRGVILYFDVYVRALRGGSVAASRNGQVELLDWSWRLLDLPRVGGLSLPHLHFGFLLCGCGFFGGPAMARVLD